MAPRWILVEQPARGWRRRLHEVVFEAETPAGRVFDFALLALILASVAAVLAESIPSVRASYGERLHRLEWGFTILFTVEYGLRLAAVARPLSWARSFYGIVDLLAVLPTYLALVLPGAQTLLVLRALRLLRIFRILKLAALLDEAAVLRAALVASRRKIFVFLSTVMILLLLIGSAMYLVEGEEHGFASIPASIYWAVVTLTTVGYGDLAPQTPLGRVLASFVMLLGYAILAVPTGIVTSELMAARGRPLPTTEACPTCGHPAHDADALFCKRCGAKL